MAIEKIKILGALLELLPIWTSFEVNGLDWQCCLKYGFHKKYFQKNEPLTS